MGWRGSIDSEPKDLIKFGHKDIKSLQGAGSIRAFWPTCSPEGSTRHKAVKKHYRIPIPCSPQDRMPVVGTMPHPLFWYHQHRKKPLYSYIPEQLPKISRIWGPFRPSEQNLRIQSSRGTFHVGLWGAEGLMRVQQGQGLEGLRGQHERKTIR